MKIYLPNTDRTIMRIFPQLAAEIGLNESLMFLQLEFLISIAKTEKHEDKKWTYQSIRDLQENYFPFWSTATVNRTLKSIEEKKLVHVGNFNKHKYDKTRWFSINWEIASELKSIKIIDSETGGVFQNDTRSNHNDTRSTQNDTTIPETTTETTTEVKKRKEEGFIKSEMAIVYAEEFPMNGMSNLTLDLLKEIEEFYSVDMFKMAIKKARGSIKGSLSINYVKTIMEGWRKDGIPDDVMDIRPKSKEPSKKIELPYWYNEILEQHEWYENGKLIKSRKGKPGETDES